MRVVDTASSELALQVGEHQIPAAAINKSVNNGFVLLVLPLEPHELSCVGLGVATQETQHVLVHREDLILGQVAVALIGVRSVHHEGQLADLVLQLSSLLLKFLVVLLNDLDELLVVLDLVLFSSHEVVNLHVEVLRHVAHAAQQLVLLANAGKVSLGRLPLPERVVLLLRGVVQQLAVPLEGVNAFLAASLSCVLARRVNQVLVTGLELVVLVGKLAHLLLQKVVGALECGHVLLHLFELGLLLAQGLAHLRLNDVVHAQGTTLQVLLLSLQLLIFLQKQAV